MAGTLCTAVSCVYKSFPRPLISPCEMFSVLYLSGMPQLNESWGIKILSQHSSGRAVDVQLMVFQDIWSDSGHLQRAAEVPPRLCGNTRSWWQEKTCQVGAMQCARHRMVKEKLCWTYGVFLLLVSLNEAPRSVSCLLPGNLYRATRVSRYQQTSSS